MLASKTNRVLADLFAFVIKFSFLLHNDLFQPLFDFLRINCTNENKYSTSPPLSPIFLYLYIPFLFRKRTNKHPAKFPFKPLSKTPSSFPWAFPNSKFPFSNPFSHPKKKPKTHTQTLTKNTQHIHTFEFIQSSKNKKTHRK